MRHTLLLANWPIWLLAHGRELYCMVSWGAPTAQHRAAAVVNSAATRRDAAARQRTQFTQPTQSSSYSTIDGDALKAARLFNRNLGVFETLPGMKRQREPPRYREDSEDAIDEASSGDEGVDGSLQQLPAEAQEAVAPAPHEPEEDGLSQGDRR